MWACLSGATATRSNSSGVALLLIRHTQQTHRNKSPTARLYHAMVPSHCSGCSRCSRSTCRHTLASGSGCTKRSIWSSSEHCTLRNERMQSFSSFCGSNCTCSSSAENSSVCMRSDSVLFTEAISAQILQSMLFFVSDGASPAGSFFTSSFTSSSSCASTSTSHTSSAASICGSSSFTVASHAVR